MSEQTAISWTDSTFNPWIGCTKVGPGCDHCYAATLMDTRYGKVKWGAGQARARTSPANWRKPVQWNVTPFYECGCGYRGTLHDLTTNAVHRCDLMFKRARRRVFCASLADVFDNEVDPQWRDDLFDLIARTPNLDWLLLTKRIGNAAKIIGAANPGADFATAFPNVWLGATMVNRDEMLRDARKLKEVPARVRFWSVEPMLGAFGDIPSDLLPDWVIAGGESGHGARPMHPGWLRSLRDQCAAAGVPFHFKQWGAWSAGEIDCEAVNEPRTVFEQARKHYWPEGHASYYVGKKAAGRLLDRRVHNGFPAASAASNQG